MHRLRALTYNVQRISSPVQEENEWWHCDHAHSNHLVEKTTKSHWLDDILEWINLQEIYWNCISHFSTQKLIKFIEFDDFWLKKPHSIYYILIFGAMFRPYITIFDSERATISSYNVQRSYFFSEKLNFINLEFWKTSWLEK